MKSGSLIDQKCENSSKFALFADSTLNFTQFTKIFTRAVPAVPATFQNFGEYIISTFPMGSKNEQI